MSALASQHDSWPDLPALVPTGYLPDIFRTLMESTKPFGLTTRDLEWEVRGWIEMGCTCAE